MNLTVFEYLVSVGQLTITANTNPLDYVTIKDDGLGAGLYIAKWTFPQPQMTLAALAAVESSQGFINHLIGKERDVAKKRLDAEQRFLIKILIKEINKGRKYERDIRNAWNTAAGATPAAFLADLKAKILAIQQDGQPPEISLQDVKDLFNQET